TTFWMNQGIETTIENCVIDVLGMELPGEPGGKLTVRHSVVGRLEGRGGQKTVGINIEIDHCVFRNPEGRCLYFVQNDGVRPSVTATGSLFRGRGCVLRIDNGKDGGWSGEHNVFRVASP